MTACIYLLSDRRYNTATSFLIPTLRTVFGQNIAIHTVDEQGLSHPGMWNPQTTCLVVMPPITGEKSTYNTLLTEKIRRLEYQYIERGGVSWRICASAYHAFQKIEFNSPTPPYHRKEKNSSTPLFSGTAYGPLLGLGKEVDPNRKIHHSIITPIECILDGQVTELYLAYSNGCSFKDLDVNTKVIAHYVYNGVKRPAIVEKNIGHGFVIASGIEPHYGYQKKPPQSLKDINEALRPHEVLRSQFMLALLGRMAQHAVKRDIMKEKDLRTASLQMKSNLEFFPSPDKQSPLAV